MSEPKIVTTAVVFSLVAGILIILGNLYAAIWGIGMILGILSGIAVLFCAIMLKIRPGEGTRGLRACCRAWGTGILLFSIASLLGGSMGELIGATFGIVGGGLALTAKV